MTPHTAEQPVPTPTPAPATAPDNGAAWEVPPEAIPNIDDIVIEDGKPVDNLFVEKQYRLLTEPLYNSWAGPGEGRSFKALANVGLFHTMGQPAVVPDVMLSLDIPASVDMSRKENLSYLRWVVGKSPDVVIEIVSDRRGGEDTHKLRDYARIAIPYYVIFDPREYLNAGVLRAFGLTEGTYRPIDHRWLSNVGLGLLLWEGTYEGQQGRWLRWCDQQGQVILTGHEQTEQERLGREQAEARAQRLAEQLRALGIEPVK